MEAGQNAFELCETQRRNLALQHLTELALQKSDPVEQAYWLHAIGNVEAAPVVVNGINVIARESSPL